MHLTGIGFGGLGIDDTTVLQPGTIVTFEVAGYLCPLGFAPGAQDITTALNNWTGSMITINAVQQTAAGYVPGQFDFQVNATVAQTMPAGDLRGQIVAAMNAFGSASSCNSVQLVNNALNVAGGGTGPVAPAPAASPSILDSIFGTGVSGFSWGLAAAGLLAVVVLLKE